MFTYSVRSVLRTWNIELKVSSLPAIRASTICSADSIRGLFLRVAE